LPFQSNDFGEVLMIPVAAARSVLPALALASALVLAAGCASTPKLPPKASPEEVRVYDPSIGQFPPENYKAIGPIRVERPLGTAQSELILALRTEAAKLGADGIIIQRIGRTAEGAADPDLMRDERAVAEALAIYYPPSQ
jgi:type IV pilus biogenesis protein CpaD/CtpE